MRKVILSLICAVTILSACEKIVLKDPSTNPISVTNPSDTSKVTTPVTTPPVVIPPVTTPPTTTPPVTTPPTTTPPVTTPPVTTPPVVTPPVTPPVTTPPVVTTMSFSKDVVPVLTMCNNCHTHGWKTSTVASTFYTNLVSKGYVNATSYTSSTIYTKLNSGHPGAGNISKVNTDKIITWMKEGSKNN